MVGGDVTEHCVLAKFAQCMFQLLITWFSVSSIHNVSCVPVCAYLEEYPSTLPSQQDAFLVEMTSSGQCAWSKSRISTQQEGAVFSNVLIAAGGSDLQGEFLDRPLYHEIYLSFTVAVQNNSTPPFVFLGTSSFVETGPFEVTVSMPSKQSA